MSKTFLIVAVRNQSLVGLLATALAQAGFRVILAETGRDCLFLARREKPDLIILDIVVPSLTGQEFAQLGQQSEVEVLLLTARWDEAKGLTGLKLRQATLCVEAGQEELQIIGEE